MKSSTTTTTESPKKTPNFYRGDPHVCTGCLRSVMLCNCANVHIVVAGARAWWVVEPIRPAVH